MFDAEEHKTRQELLRYARAKYPDEKNITKLYHLACRDRGIEPTTLSTKIADHLPTPAESAREHPESKFNLACPKCGKRTYVLHGLCTGCKEAEGGTYKTAFRCHECGHYERSKEPLVIWMQRLGIEFGTQSKKSLGVKTITDDGVK